MDPFSLDISSKVPLAALQSTSGQSKSHPPNQNYWFLKPSDDRSIRFGTKKPKTMQKWDWKITCVTNSLQHQTVGKGKNRPSLNAGLPKSQSIRQSDQSSHDKVFPTVLQWKCFPHTPTQKTSENGQFPEAYNRMFEAWIFCVQMEIWTIQCWHKNPVERKISICLLYL